MGSQKIHKYGKEEKGNWNLLDFVTYVYTERRKNAPVELVRMVMYVNQLVFMGRKHWRGRSDGLVTKERIYFLQCKTPTHMSKYETGAMYTCLSYMYKLQKGENESNKIGWKDTLYKAPQFY